MIDKEEFLQWKNNIVTKKLLEDIKLKQNEVKDYIAFGGSLGEHLIQNTARAVGIVGAFQDVIDWNPLEETNYED